MSVFTRSVLLPVVTGFPLWEDQQRESGAKPAPSSSTPSKQRFTALKPPRFKKGVSAPHRPSSTHFLSWTVRRHLLAKSPAGASPRAATQLLSYLIQNLACPFRILSTLGFCRWKWAEGHAPLVGCISEKLVSQQQPPRTAAQGAELPTAGLGTRRGEGDSVVPPA